MSDCTVLSLVDAEARPVAAVALSAGAIGLHAGIAYTSSSAASRVLHLTWHYDLRVATELTGWVFVVPQLDPMEQQLLAGACELLKSVMPRVPYGFRYPGASFDKHGRFVPGDSTQGMTCATFVLAIFELARVPLLLTSSWDALPASRIEEDKAAQERLVAFLQSHGAPNHANAVAREIGSMRFRSEEVAAGSGFQVRPVSHAAVMQAANDVLAAATALTSNRG